MTDLATRLWFTLGALVIYRLGSYIPLPGIDPLILQQIVSRSRGGTFDLVDMVSGGALARMSIFALSVMPYVSASIVALLMTAVVPSLATPNVKGTAGRWKPGRIVRCLTVTLAALQALGIALALEGMDGGRSAVLDAGR